MISALVLGAWSVLAAPLAVPWVPQTRAPWCAAAAALSAANAQGGRFELRPFVAQLPVHADGIAWLDLAEALRPHGFETVIFRGGPADVRRALAAGLAPVLSIRRGPGRHAVVVREAAAGAWQIVDPAVGPATLDAASVARWQGAGGPMLVISRGGRGLRASWREQTRDYVAEAWARRAQRAPESAGAVQLLDRALAARPWAELHHDRAVHLGRMGRGVEACAALERAQALLVGVPAGAVAVPGGQGRPRRVDVARALDRARRGLGCAALGRR